MRQVEPPLTRAQAPRDPAPSLWAYRMHRLWLTPMVRRLARVGLPMLAMVTGVVWYVSDEARVLALTEQVSELRRAVEERPEFMVRTMAVDGASPELDAAIRAALAIDLPRSSFDLDLPAMKREIELLGAVAGAHLRIRPGGVLQIDVDARQPAVIWRSRAGLTLLDAGGHAIALAHDRTDWPDLPLIAGQGAERAVPEALALLAAAAPLAGRLRGLVRVGERRWDLVLDREQRVMLPAREPVPALERLIALDEARDILGRDVTHVDLRDPARPILRLSDAAVEDLRRIRQIESGARP